jgi:hypothetical protein
MLFEERRELVEPLKSDGPKTKKTEKVRSHQINVGIYTLVVSMY